MKKEEKKTNMAVDCERESSEKKMCAVKREGKRKFFCIKETFSLSICAKVPCMFGCVWDSDDELCF